jgi:hypothetical protein
MFDGDRSSLYIISTKWDDMINLHYDLTSWIDVYLCLYELFMLNFSSLLLIYNFNGMYKSS